MELGRLVCGTFRIALFIKFLNAQIPAPKNIKFEAAGETNATISIDGIANVSQYEVVAQAVYDSADHRAWTMTLANGPTTSTVVIEKIDELKNNRIYVVTVAGMRDGAVGNVTGVLVRTAPSGPTLTLAQALPTVISLFVSETPGATFCEISYAKEGHEAGRKTIRSATACRAVIIQDLDPNTKYKVKVRVLKSGEFSFPDSQFGKELSVSTTKLTLFGRLRFNTEFNERFQDPTSENYIKEKSDIESTILNFYRSKGQDASAVTVIQFESIENGRSIIVHHEVQIQARRFPTNFDGYKFSTARKTYTMERIIAQVADNSYSLVKSETTHNINFEKSLPCTAYDIRKFKVIDSSSHDLHEVELQGLSLVTNTEFAINGTDITKSGANLHTLKGNTANVISQDYLLKTCPTDSQDVFYTRYVSSDSPSTTSGMQNVFIHSTGLTETPETRSIGIAQGNGSLLVFKRVPHAISYSILSKDINTTLFPRGIDSSEEFRLRLLPITPGDAIQATLVITTQPFNVIFTKEVPLKLSTLPSAISSVTWPYHDRYNLTLEWAYDEAALGYYIKVVRERDGVTIRDYVHEHPFADIHDLLPGSYYTFHVTPYNYAGNTTVIHAGYRLFTDQDPPLLSLHPVNVSSEHLTVKWTGSAGALDVTVAIYNGSHVDFSPSGMSSPTVIDGLNPNTEYNITVIATFETGVSQSPFISYRTDPLPCILSPSPVNKTHTSLTVSWTGGKDALYVDLKLSNTTTPLFMILNVKSPFEITGLLPDTEYLVSVVTTYGMRVFESKNETFRTDPAPITATTEPTPTVMVTETIDNSTELSTIAPQTENKIQKGKASSSNGPATSGSIESNRMNKTSSTKTRIGKPDVERSRNPTDERAEDSESSEWTAETESVGNNDTAGKSDSNKKLASSESSGGSDLSGGAWLMIGVVITLATMSAIVLIYKGVKTIKKPSVLENTNDESAKNSPDSSVHDSSASNGKSKTGKEAGLQMEKLGDSR